VANFYSPTLVYGDIIGVYNIDDAIIGLLKKWNQSYLNEIARQNGESFERLTKPRSYRASHEVEFMPEDQRPCCVIVCAGPEGPPEVRGSADGVGQRIQATWAYQIGIQIVASGQKIRSMPRAHQLVMMYAAAARVILENQRSDILDMKVEWRGKTPSIVESDADRTTAVAVVNFLITVPTCHIRGIGPDQPEPDDDPLPDSPHYPAVDPSKVSLTITKEPTVGEM
jgi:hypothetical protein